MSTVLGKAAEAAAAEFLKREGHKIIARNWRTRWCEIDIVTQKGQVIYFVEVKYRKNAHFGSGLEYITRAKLQQMHFAAEFWLASNAKQDYDYRLSAVSLSSEPPTVDDWLPDL